ncbi:MAG TPA: lysylphosphatidylglycerol synthase domain-containing protein, partial [Acidimicrobiales bacterium]|nr:lysylphosphatidylglycerol synthase domain-containing protein [Acidimicrobiales bacterium]
MAARPAVRPWLLLGAAAVFVAMAVGSFRALPDEGRSGNLWLVAVLVLVATPATLVLNALEYRSMAQAHEHDIDFDAAVRVSLVASLANYLPAPGGVAVRTAALKKEGSTVGSALSINAVAVVIWAGSAAAFAGIGLLAGTSRLG